MKKHKRKLLITTVVGSLALAYYSNVQGPAGLVAGFAFGIAGLWLFMDLVNDFG